MGTFSVPIEIGDPQGRTFKRADALVDTGATLTTAPASMLRRIGVRPTRTNWFTLADGRRIELGIGETRVRVEGTEVTTLVLFGPEDAGVLLGSLALEALLLGVDPYNKRLIPVEGLLMSATP